MINQVLNEYLDRFIVIYLDDILIFLDILDKHIKHVYKVLVRLEETNLLIKPEKYIFYIQEVIFLGYLITLNEV